MVKVAKIAQHGTTPHRWMLRILLCSSVLCYLLFSASVSAAMNRFPLKNKAKGPPKAPPKSKPRPPRINEALLPPIQEFLAQVELSDYLNDFVKMGFVDTKNCLRLQDMDYRMMQYEWNDMTNEKIDRLKKSVQGIAAGMLMLNIRGIMIYLPSYLCQNGLRRLPCHLKR
jgi:hypothetical protein